MVGVCEAATAPMMRATGFSSGAGPGNLVSGATFGVDTDQRDRVPQSEQRRDQVLDLQRQPFFEVADDAPAVAGLRVAAVAQQRDALAGLHERGEIGKFGLWLGLPDVRLVDFHQCVAVAGARRLPALGRGAELLKVQIGDAGFVERGGQLTLGEAGPARRGDRAHVDKGVDLRLFEFAQNRGGLGLLVADGEERQRLAGRLACFRRSLLRLLPSRRLALFRHYGTRSISAMAAAGARTLASWMK